MSKQERIASDLTFGSVGSNNKIVAVAGTAERLAAVSTLCRRVTITAYSTNGGVIWVGGSNTLAASKIGTPLNAGDSYELDADDLYDVWLDTTVNGNGVSYTYMV